MKIGILFGGEAGYGTMSAGSLTGKAAVRNGLWAHSISEFPSLIKGGLNTSHLVISDEQIASADPEVDFIGAVSQPALDINLPRLKPGGIVLYDSKAIQVDESKLPPDSVAVGIDMISMLPEGAPKVMSNAIILGTFAALTSFPTSWLREAMVSEFAEKPAVAKMNGELFDQAYEAQKDAGKPLWQFSLPTDRGERLIMNGNEAIALGALAGGVRFSAGYPMTPGTSVLSYLSDHGEPFGLLFKQAEDELAAINMLVGASFAGARALGSTSGGGFALMTEALGYAAQAELPVMMVIAQRGGPSTGLPTRTMQTDLDGALYAGAGEFPRIVVAPGDVEECFYETFRTVNLADQYQTPAIILTDKELSDSATTVEAFDFHGMKNERTSLLLEGKADYKRYEYTKTGVSPRTIPGVPGGEHIATSYTHQEDGFYSSGNKEYAEFEPEITEKSIDKMYQKFQALESDLLKAGCSSKLYGPEEAQLTIIGWGGTKGAILGALKEAEVMGLSVNYLQLIYLSPFPKKEVEDQLKKAKNMLIVEGNRVGQLNQLIRQKTGIEIGHHYYKYDSRPFTPKGILEKVQEVLGK